MTDLHQDRFSAHKQRKHIRGATWNTEVLHCKMEKVRTVLDFFLSHQKALGYGTVSLLTIGSERIFSVTVFKCPCNSWNMVYGAVFLLVPAFILFLLGLLLNTRSWKVLTGCCAPSRMGQCPNSGRFCRYMQVLWMVAASSAVAPFTWIAVALLGGSFYECAATGSSIFQQQVCKRKTEAQMKECLKMVLEVPCHTSATPSEMHTMLMNLRAQSQVGLSSSMLVDYPFGQEEGSML